VCLLRSCDERNPSLVTHCPVSPSWVLNHFFSRHADCYTVHNTACMFAHTHTHRHTHRHTQARTHTYTHARANTQMHTRARTHIHTHAQTYTQTLKHTNTHEHTYTPRTVYHRVCAYWLGSSPETFYRLYTGLGVVLFTFRYLVYRARKW